MSLKAKKKLISSDYYKYFYKFWVTISGSLVFKEYWPRIPPPAMVGFNSTMERRYVQQNFICWTFFSLRCLFYSQLKKQPVTWSKCLPQRFCTVISSVVFFLPSDQVRAAYLWIKCFKWLFKDCCLICLPLTNVVEAFSINIFWFRCISASFSARSLTAILYCLVLCNITVPLGLVTQRNKLAFSNCAGLIIKIKYTWCTWHPFLFHQHG